MDIEGRRAFRFSSLLLSDEHRVLKECPRGAVLREAPWVYDLRSMHGLAYNAGFDMLDLPRYTYRMLCILAQEESRLKEMEKENQSHKNDSRAASRVLRGG